MRRDQQRLNDITEALDWIAKAISGRTEAEFLADETLCYAVAQRLTVVGEAVARLTPEITTRHNSVPWPDIVGCETSWSTSTSASIGRLSGRLPSTTRQACGSRSQ
jgi:uncharacterized protein with HEPN domain